MKHLVAALVAVLSLALPLIVAGSTQDPWLPRPLVIDLPTDSDGGAVSDFGRRGAWIRCASWRVAGEANNLAPWLTVPAECGDYVREYMTGPAYRSDLDVVAEQALVFARSVHLAGDGRDAWIFDIDETLLSNLPYYADNGFGLDAFDGKKFDKWVERAMAPTVHSSLRLYEEVLLLGFKIILLTGRSEAHRNITVDNLKQVGFGGWEKLILRGPNDRSKSAEVYKSEKRCEVMSAGYRIHGNSGDQWSDLIGSSLSSRSFKLPNPMYFIP